ncbi:YjbF family lipoprotein [Wenxinia marina]|uniref:Group 4 capsule polysaccharide formation lipoprotein gfcB n=1 Tax=Wenxinia marina DSM 24838 TaxID=1123501 RepID=A0A0D0NQ26_9RHOB|nr:YjbF family lipoprotein [Wenxinia marina]KIQ70380.1 hypothetical protein Wenmar_00756 [Wenxinia marina DSM 24838]GGL53637.1 hypothetical protein GCM10011392_04970 [Wenxinia marina]
MARTLTALVAALGVGLLSGCATGDSSSGGPGGGPTGLLGSLSGIIPGLGGGAEQTAQPPGFAATDLAAAPAAFQLMWLPTFTSPGLARIIQNNGGDLTLESQYGFDAAFRDGFLVGTRGLTEDLMGAYVADVRSALRAGGGTAVRIHDTLDGLDQIEQQRYDCTVSADGREEVDLGVRTVVARKFVESCRNAFVQFENLYWLDDRGDIVASRQFVTQTVAYLRSNRL